jgi:hypothetical protein
MGSSCIQYSTSSRSIRPENEHPSDARPAPAPPDQRPGSSPIGRRLGAAELDPAGDDVLGGGTKEWNEPSLILHEGVYAPAGAYLPQQASAGVALRAAPGEGEQRAGPGGAIDELEAD